MLLSFINLKELPQMIQRIMNIDQRMKLLFIEGSGKDHKTKSHNSIFFILCHQMFNK